ncbi:MAG: hypothetical protein R3A12_09135 [Ignavibacteria bacterium]
MGGSQGQVMALGHYGTDLIAAGFFTSAGGQSANHIAKWNGTSWSTLEQVSATLFIHLLNITAI